MPYSKTVAQYCGAGKSLYLPFAPYFGDLTKKLPLGRCEALEIVQKYTRSITFEDSMKHYRAPLSE